MADPATYRPAPGEIPDSPGVYRFRDEHGRVIYVGKAKSLRSRLSSYFQDLSGPAPAHPADGDDGGVGAVDGGRDRGRGARARVLVDQGVRPAVQREVPRRQVVPVPRGDAGRRVPARPGDAGRQAQGHALLRPVRARVGDPGDRRPAAAGVPGPDLLGGRVQAGAPAGPAVPARVHRQVLGAVRRPDLAGRPPALAQDFCDFMAGDTAKFTRRLDRAHEGGGRGAGLRARGAAAGRHRDARAGHREERRRARRTARTPTSSRWPATSSRPPSRCSTCATGASAASAAGSSRRSRTSPTRELVEHLLQQIYGERRPAAGLTAARARRRSRARCSSRCCRPTSSRCRRG